MSSTFERGVLTQWLVDFLAASTDIGAPVGKVLAPEGGGWQKDSATPGAVFVPYPVVTPGSAQPVSPSIGDPSQSWTAAYQISTYGVDGTQVEDLADAVRKLLLATKNTVVTMDGREWKITTIACPNIGGVGYTTAVTPPAYSQTDSYSLSLSRRLT